MKLIIIFFSFFLHSQNNESFIIDYQMIFNNKYKEDKNYTELDISIKNGIDEFMSVYDYLQKNQMFTLKYQDNQATFISKDKNLPPDYFSNLQKSFYKSIIDVNFYYSIKDSLIYNNYEFNGKKFNVLSKFNEQEWNILNETTMINGYLCFKASLKSNPIISVWFTPEISCPVGPYGYVGLPGLILQLNSYNVTYVCKRFTFEQFEINDIKKPIGIDISKKEMEEMKLKAKLSRQ